MADGLQSQNSVLRKTLTHERLLYLLNYDPVTGVFTRNVGAGGTKAGAKAGYLHKSTGYWFVKVDGQAYGAHRLAWFYVHGVWPEGELDHENTNTLDNWIANLREASNSANGANKPRYKNNVCGLKGVHLHRSTGKWKAQIKKDGRVTHLGLFTTREEAHAAYIGAARALHGMFARMI